MPTETPLLLALDLAGTFAFALNGALTAMKVTKVDVVGVVTLGMVTALGGGILLLDAAGLGLFAVTGAGKALDLGVGAAQAVILGAVTAVGGGTVRDVLITRVPVILRRELYAIPALLAAALVVVAQRTGFFGPAAAIGAALLCFAARTAGMRYRLNAPGPPRPPTQPGPPGPPGPPGGRLI
ncbi:MAG: TRIC cation channel family protein [Actinomycetota bacterium]|nr:TRIC cation channel family protein [Actinomycetota bacterium]